MKGKGKIIIEVYSFFNFLPQANNVPEYNVYFDIRQVLSSFKVDCPDRSYMLFTKDRKTREECIKMISNKCFAQTKIFAACMHI